MKLQDINAEEIVSPTIIYEDVEEESTDYLKIKTEYQDIDERLFLGITLGHGLSQSNFAFLIFDRNKLKQENHISISLECEYHEPIASARLLQKSRLIELISAEKLCS